MALVIYTPNDDRAHSHDLGTELQALVEAMSILEFGTLPEEILKKIA